MNHQAQLFIEHRHELAEGPVYDHRTNSLLWVDILPGKVYRQNLADSASEEFSFDAAVGCVVPDTAGRLIVALPDGPAVFDPSNGKLTPLCSIEADIATNRFNDGKCDPRGRLWLGTMNYDARPNAGALYCVEKGSVSKKLDRLTISNGLAWNPDRRKFYFIDSPTGAITQYDYDPESGAIRNPQTVVVITDELGIPDGMCIDENGHLWVAIWGGSCVLNIDPISGAIVDRVQLPVPQVTSCAFGGLGFKTLFITTASTGLSEEELDEFPLSGCLFKIIPGVAGTACDFYEP